MKLSLPISAFLICMTASYIHTDDQSTQEPTQQQNNEALQELESFDIQSNLAQPIPQDVYNHLSSLLDQLTTLLHQQSNETVLTPEAVAIMTNIVQLIIQAHIQILPPDEQEHSCAITKHRPRQTEDIVITPAPAQSQSEKVITVIVGTLANIASNVTAIINAKKNPKIITSCIANLLATLANIVQQIRRSPTACTQEEAAAYLAVHTEHAQQLIDCMLEHVASVESYRTR
jgi:hypothetical protein